MTAVPSTHSQTLNSSAAFSRVDSSHIRAPTGTVRLIVSSFGGGLFNERPRDSTESGAFSFVAARRSIPLFATETRKLPKTPGTVKPSVQSACICFKSSRLWDSFPHVSRHVVGPKRRKFRFRVRSQGPQTRVLSGPTHMWESMQLLQLLSHP